jgi:putative lipoprotein
MRARLQLRRRLISTSVATAIGAWIGGVPLSSSVRAGEPVDPWFGRDKALHFAATATIATAGYGGAALVTDDRTARVVAGASLAMAAGIGKELWDLAGHGDPSWKDLTWDAIGSATGVLTARAIDWLVVRVAARP